MEAKAHTVLIVDDEPLNLKMLKAHLQAEGYEILEAANGPDALKMAEKNPDLILLDVMMPEMDGFETCRRLKEDPSLCDIPVIFLSALHDTKSKVKGLDAGGVDYVDKPFEARELLARVKTHVTLRQQEQQIKDYAAYLKQMVDERTHQLVHADRLATLGTFSAAVVHEINNPNTFIGGNADLLRVFWESARPLMERHLQEDSTGRVKKSIDKVEYMIDSILEGSRRITKIVNTLKNYGRRGKSQMCRCPLTDPLRDALNLVEYRLKHGIIIETMVAEDLELWCDPQKITQVFVNLINNAIDAMEGGSGKINIRARRVLRGIEIRVGDTGPGIPQEAVKEAFTPFFTTKPHERGTGLGLFIVRNIVIEHQGEVSISRSEAGGAEFVILLPTGSDLDLEEV